MGLGLGLLCFKDVFSIAFEVWFEFVFAFRLDGVVFGFGWFYCFGVCRSC